MQQAALGTPGETTGSDIHKEKAVAHQRTGTMLFDTLAKKFMAGASLPRFSRAIGSEYTDKENKSNLALFAKTIETCSRL